MDILTSVIPPNHLITNYQNITPFNDRRDVATTMLSCFPNKVPIIIEEYFTTMAPVRLLGARSDTTDIVYTEISKNIKVDDHDIYLYVQVDQEEPTSGNVLINIYKQGILYVKTPDNLKLIHRGLKISDLYTRYHNKDGFLYMIYRIKNTYMTLK